MAHFRLFSSNGKPVAINVDLVAMIKTNDKGNAEVLFVGSTEFQEFFMSAKDLYNQLANTHINLD